MNIAGSAVIVFSMALAPSGKDGAVMTPAEVDSLTRTDAEVLLLDVRTPEEFTGSLGHLEGALLIPVQELSGRLDELDAYHEHTVVVYCRTGNRSHYATELLRARGFDAYNMTGGMVQWNREDRPTVRPEGR